MDVNGRESAGGPLADVTDAELAVLRVVWDRTEATRRTIADVIYPGRGPAHYTTVQKLLERLEAKGCVASELIDGIRVFRARVDRDQLIRHRLGDVADKLCDGQLTPVLMNLVGSHRWTPQEIEELRSLVIRLSAPDTK